MAHYMVYHVRYRGRLIAVDTRYGILRGAGGVHVIKGKSLDLNGRDIRKIWLILQRQEKRYPARSL